MLKYCDEINLWGLLSIIFYYYLELFTWTRKKIKCRYCGEISSINEINERKVQLKFNWKQTQILKIIRRSIKWAKG